MSQVKSDSKDRVRSRSARTLVVASLAVQLIGREENGTVLALGEEAAVLSVHADVLAVSAVQDGIVVGDTEGTVGLDVDGEDGVIAETETNGEIKPLLLRGNVDAALLSSLDLLLGTNAGVEEEAGGGEGTGSEDDAAIVSESDDLSLTGGSLNLDTGDFAAGSNDAEDLSTELKVEVVLLLGQREIGTDGTSALLVLDVPGRIAIDLVLLVGLGDHVDGLPTNGVEEFGENRVQTLIVTLAISRRQSCTRVALVEPLSSRLDILPFPSFGPVVVVVEVVLRRVNKDHIVHGDTSTKNAGGHSLGIGANVLVPDVEVTNISRHTGQVNGCEVLVPGQSLVGTSGNGRTNTSLEKQDLLASLDKPLSGDNTGRTTTDNNVVIVVVLEAGSRC